MPTTQKTRKRIPSKIEAELLIQCRRRCCLCVFLDDDHEQHPGQIAHIDGDPSNNTIENLAFLCLKHHESFDSRSRQAKGITPDEIRHARKELVNKFNDALSFVVKLRVNADYDTERDAVVNKLLELIRNATDGGDFELMDVSRGSVQVSVRLTAEQVRDLFRNIDSPAFEELGVDEATIEKVEDYWSAKHDSGDATGLRAHNAHLERVVIELTEQLEMMVEKVHTQKERSSAIEEHLRDLKQRSSVEDI